MRYITLTSEHVGKRVIFIDGRPNFVSDFIGQIRTYDVGKRVYINGDVLQVENDEQFQNRVAKGKIA